jgi:hypothetical protein
MSSGHADDRLQWDWARDLGWRMAIREQAGNGTGVRSRSQRWRDDDPHRAVVSAVYYGVATDPTVTGAYPRLAIGGDGARRQHRHMEVTTTRSSAGRLAIAPFVRSLLLGTMLIVGGLTLAYAAFATPLLTVALPAGRPSTGQMAVGMAVWAAALVAPAAFLLMGTNRLARLLATLRGPVPHGSRLAEVLAPLGSDVTVTSGLVLPDGRGVADLVVGPFGAVVLRELPPPAVTRVQGGHWHLRTPRGWVPMENPLERAARDADRVRRWLGHDDADFVVKVHAAVIGTDPTIQRTPTCAVLTPDQVYAWVAALPPQRRLTPGRRQVIMDTVRGARR